MQDNYYDRKKKNLQSSVWRVRDRYYDRKKKILVVCLVGARSLLQPEKKVLVVCLAGARLLLQPEKKTSSRDFYEKLNVSNLNVTNLY